MNAKDDKVEKFSNMVIKYIFLSVVTLLVCFFVTSRYDLRELPAINMLMEMLS